MYAKITPETFNTEKKDIRNSYNETDYSDALTSAEWKKYNYAMRSHVDAGLRISDHSMLVECENGQFSYKLVIYDIETQDNDILGVYGIGENLYNEDRSNFDQEIIGEFLIRLEDRQYDNKQVFERILRSYSKDVGYVLWRYNSRSHRYNRYGRKVSQGGETVQQQYDGSKFYRSDQKAKIKNSYSEIDLWSPDLFDIEEEKISEYLEELYKILSSEYPEHFDRDVYAIRMPMALLQGLNKVAPQYVGSEKAFNLSAERMAVLMSSDILCRI